MATYGNACRHARGAFRKRKSANAHRTCCRRAARDSARAAGGRSVKSTRFLWSDAHRSSRSRAKPASSDPRLASTHTCGAYSDTRMTAYANAYRHARAYSDMRMTASANAYRHACAYSDMRMTAYANAYRHARAYSDMRMTASANAHRHACAYLDMRMTAYANAYRHARTPAAQAARPPPRGSSTPSPT